MRYTASRRSLGDRTERRAAGGADALPTEEDTMFELMLAGSWVLFFVVVAIIRTATGA